MAELCTSANRHTGNRFKLHSGNALVPNVPCRMSDRARRGLRRRVSGGHTERSADRCRARDTKRWRPDASGDAQRHARSVSRADTHGHGPTLSDPDCHAGANSCANSHSRAFE